MPSVRRERLLSGLPRPLHSTLGTTFSPMPVPSPPPFQGHPAWPYVQAGHLTHLGRDLSREGPLSWRRDGGWGGASQSQGHSKAILVACVSQRPSPSILAVLGCCRVGPTVAPVPCLLRPRPLGPPGSPFGTHTLDTGVQLGFWTTENLYNSLYIYS